MTTTDLRTHLQALAAGNSPKSRGNAVTPADIDASKLLARALRALVASSFNFQHHDESQARATAPSELLPPLP